jgi:AcrR family transcriptional regulator
VASGNETVERILNGALRVIARRGAQRLSMSDVCEEAGVSRGTLYRYFTNKNDVLLRISQHVRDGSAAAIQRAIAADPAPERRLYVVVHALVHYGEVHPEAVLAIEAEPAFAIMWLRRIFPEYVTMLAEALEPVLDASPAVQAGTVTRTGLAEVVLRVIMSTYLVPAADSEAVGLWITGMWDSITADSRGAGLPDAGVPA